MAMVTPRVHFWVIGHRGSPEREVENTIESFERALVDGANGLELDPERPARAPAKSRSNAGA